MAQRRCWERSPSWPGRTGPNAHGGQGAFCRAGCAEKPEAEREVRPPVSPQASLATRLVPVDEGKLRHLRPLGSLAAFSATACVTIPNTVRRNQTAAHVDCPCGTTTASCRSPVSVATRAGCRRLTFRRN